MSSLFEELSLRWPGQSPSPLVLLLTVAGAILCQKVVALYRSRRTFNGLPGRTYLLSPTNTLSNFVFPPIRGFCPGKNFLFEDKYTEFEKQGYSAYRITALTPSIQTMLVLADADAIKEVTSSRARFPKPTELYGSLAFFGRNIVVSEADEWKKYRKIAAPAFSEKNNRMVWDETVSIVNDLFNGVWGDKKVIEVDHACDITMPLALFVIGGAGFGQLMRWNDSKVPPAGHRLTFKDALHNVACDVFIKLAVPGWAMGLTQRTRDAQMAFDELEQYMLEMIHDRSASGATERSDLFSNLLKSNDTATGAANVMTTRELQGNIFIFLIAGHETTAHTLAYTLGLLALFQDEQEKVYQQIKEVLPNGEAPSYDDRLKLDRCLAAIYETMRFIPPVTNVPKYSAEDTTLTIHNNQGEKAVIPVPAGTGIAMNIAGLHYNPLYWEDPYAFKHERFLGDYNRDAYLPFSGGSRACIGRKFAELEAVSALAMLLSRYKVTIKEEPEFAHETFEEKKERILSSRAGITVTPNRMPLTFTRRD